MGLRKLFRGLRLSDRKESSTSPLPSLPAADTTNSEATTPVTSSHSSPEANFTTEHSTPRDLWDEAYIILSREDPKLKQRYEEIVLTQDEINGEPSQNRLAPAGSYQREQQLRQIAKSKVEEVDLAKWQPKIGSHSVDVGGGFDKAVKIGVAAKEFVSSAVSSEPHAALVWAGVCIFLPDLAAHEGLEAAPFAVRRLRAMERLIRPGKSGLTRSSYHPDSLELVKDFEDAAVDLYKTILEFQIRLARQYSDNWAKRYGRDVFKADDWMGLTNRIKSLEVRCTEIAQDLSRERIESALQVSESNMQRGLHEVQQELKKTTRGIEQQTMMQSAWRQTDEERKCVQLFRQSNSYENQKGRTPKRVLETGKWFLENDKFLDWRENEGPDLLWLSAKPGSGKSVLAKTIIDKELAISNHQKQSAVCYFFFKDISPYQRSALSAISAILHQLFSAFPSLVKHALMPYQLNGKEPLHLFHKMFGILCQAATDPIVGQVVCVLDALDDCGDEDRFSLIEAITNFYHKANNSSSFHDLMKETPTIHLSGDHESERIKDEIDLVIDVKIPKVAAERGFDEKATKYLLEELHTVDNRTYLWLSLIMDEIRLSERPANKRELKRIISALPQSLIDAYDKILKRCRHPSLARQLLHIILAAREPLTVEDMKIATALASDLEYRSYDEIGIERSDAEMRIKDACGLMVAIDYGSVFLIHQTAKEFLIKNDDATQNSETWKHSFSPLDSETLLAKVCITLLSFTSFAETPLTIDGDDDEPYKRITEFAENNAFLEYAAMNWLEHSNQAKLDDNPKWMPSMLSLCSVDKPAFRTWYAFYQRLTEYRFPRKMTSLNIAAEFNFSNVVASLLESGEDPDEPDGLGATPLARSVQKSKRAMELLLDANADINAQGWEDDELDASGSEVEDKSFIGTPLIIAVFGGVLEIVEYLIKRGVEINFPPHRLLTPLYAAYIMCAADNQSKMTEMFRLLLRSGANPCFEVADPDWPVEITVLHLAAMDKYPWVLSIHLGSETTDVNFQLRELQSNDPTEGQSSVDGGRSPSNKHTLSQNGSNSDSGRGASGSSEDEDSEVGSEADNNALIPDNDSSSGFNFDGHQSDSSDSTHPSLNKEHMVGATPLHLAVRSEYVENVKLLLEHGADPHIKNASGYTAMDLALELPPTENSGDDTTLTTMKAEMIELLEKYSHVSSDGKEFLPRVTSIDG
ncbi:hypothetical protein N7501_002692 [Penicillium viridicatum]|nr:hypothetical protein N7501_002692 [Penicillium viridicatum]